MERLCRNSRSLPYPAVSLDLRLLTSGLHLLVLPSRGYLNLPSQGNELKPQQHSLSEAER